LSRTKRSSLFVRRVSDEENNVFTTSTTGRVTIGVGVDVVVVNDIVGDGDESATAGTVRERGQHRSPLLPVQHDRGGGGAETDTHCQKGTVRGNVGLGF
jgi:hypothetical protein